MNSKKKFIIAVCSLGVVALSAIIALVAVIAAFNASTTDGGFKITYSAKNVHATITAQYKVMASASDTEATYTTIKNTDGTDSIVFTGDETDATVSESFEAVNAIALEKDGYVYIHYTITNTDSVDGTTFRVTSDSEITTENNLVVEYATSEDATEWKSSLAQVADVSSVANGTPLNIYVRISVETKTMGATFDGSFNFTLTINE